MWPKKSNANIESVSKQAIALRHVAGGNSNKPAGERLRLKITRNSYEKTDQGRDG